MANYPKVSAKIPCIALLLFFCLLGNRVKAQEGWSAARFGNINNQERYRYVHDYPFYKIDSGQVLNTLFTQMRAIARKHDDIRTLLAVDFYNCITSGNKGVKIPGGISSDSLMRNMQSVAKQYNFPVEETVAGFYILENLGNSHKITYEQRYTAIMESDERMRSIGYERFREYYVQNIMLRMAMVMWELEDYDKAYHYLTVAERFATATDKGIWHYIQVMSYLQTYWKIKKYYARSLQFAFKIRNSFDKYKPTNESATEFVNFWRGFSTIEIADLLIKQGKFKEGERYADNGYLLSKAPDNPVNAIPAYQSEYDALIVLIDVKLLIGKIGEAGALLQRAQYLKTWLEARGQLEYFKPLKLYRYLAEFNEKRGDAATALNYIHKADVLQDSLTRRNDAHKLARAQQRLESEKYAQRIAVVEKEKGVEKTLRNAMIVILVLVVSFGIVYLKSIQLKRRQKEAELAVTKLQLQQQTQILREKSEQADKLNAEMEKLSASGQRSEYLEQLTQATILTDEDWLSFKNLFEKVYPNFIAQQKQLYPAITPAEIRLVVLEKLELNTQEMANMLGVSKNTIHQTRLRLRKKTENTAV